METCQNLAVTDIMFRFNEGISVSQWLQKLLQNVNEQMWDHFEFPETLKLVSHGIYVLTFFFTKLGNLNNQSLYQNKVGQVSILNSIRAWHIALLFFLKLYEKGLWSHFLLVPMLIGVCMQL